MTQAFHKNGNRRGCKLCIKARAAEWQKQHSEYENRKSRQWRQDNRERFAATSRNSILKRKYGITDAQFNEILAAQNYVCAVCKRDEPRANSKLAVDHCHATGKVRGLLCTKCNTAIGLLDDSPGLAMELLNYMKKHRQLQFSLPTKPSVAPK